MDLVSGGIRLRAGEVETHPERVPIEIGTRVEVYGSRRRLPVVRRYAFVTIDDNENQIELVLDDDFTAQGDALDVGDTVLLSLGGNERPWKAVDIKRSDSEVKVIVEPP